MINKEQSQYINFSIIIAAVLITLFSLLINLSNIRLVDFFFQNMEPELIGIGIEILIIIWVFEIWQNKRQHEKNIIHEKRLREYLLFFLKFGFIDLPKDIQITNFYGENYLNNTKEIDRIIKFIDDNQMEEYQFLFMKKHFMIDKSALENLLDVASFLTDRHFKVWIRIVYFINILSTTDDENIDEIKKIIIKILVKIKKFDKASYDSKIYVGAEKLDSHFSIKNILNSISKKVGLFLIISILINISLFFIKLDNKTEIDNEKIITKNIKTATDENNSILLIANEMNYSLVVVFSFFLFFLWLYYKNYKNEIVDSKQIIYSFILSCLLSVSGAITFKMLSIDIEEIGFETNITFYKQINNYNNSENNNEIAFKHLRTLEPFYIYFEKGLILNNGKCSTDDSESICEKEKCIENLKNIFLSNNNKYLIKLTGYSSLERVKNKNRMNNNYDISIARANNIKNLLLNITDEKQIERKNIVIDIFANSNQSVTSEHHYLNQKVKIEVIELEPVSKI